MRIALIAHDSRKELMAQFCTAYVRILSENDPIATGVTGKIVHDATGLPVRTLYPGGRGGAEQIAAMIGCGEVDMLLFFRDPVGAKPGEPNDMMLLRCATCTRSLSPQTRHRGGSDPRSGERRPGLDRAAAWSEITKKATPCLEKRQGVFMAVGAGIVRPPELRGGRRLPRVVGDADPTVSMATPHNSRLTA